jgi:hypothetical protein
MYYRVAIQIRQSQTWKWQSTPLSSLSALFQWLQFYRAFPHDRLRIFSSCSREEMHELLVQANQGLLSTSVTATQFLQERMICSPEVVQRTSELQIATYREKTPIAVTTQPSVSESGRGVNIPDGRSTSSLERRRLELESGVGGDHDVPYHFAFPASMPQVLAWMRLLASVHRGEVKP